MPICNLVHPSTAETLGHITLEGSIYRYKGVRFTDAYELCSWATRKGFVLDWIEV